MSPITVRFAGLSPAALKVLSRSGAPPEDQAEDESKREQDKDEKESGGTADALGAPTQRESSFADMPRDQLVDALSGEDQKNGLPPQDGELKTEEESFKESMELSDDAPLGLIAELCAESMRLDKEDAWKYARSLEKWRATIRRIAEVFLKLASPTEMLFSPRYDHSAMPQGFRLHPLRINQAAVQQITRTPLAIWQPVKRSGRRQDLGFGGLDVYLLMDVSGSMEGEKARCAADAALCIIEGLQMASYMARGKTTLKRPDVRIEFTAFGADFSVICPLSYEPTGEQKGKVFFSLRNAASKGTYISGALDNIRRSAQHDGRRKKLIFIISDGRFHDPGAAGEAARSLRAIAQIKQVFITETGTVISDSHETITAPLELPEKLFELLQKDVV